MTDFVLKETNSTTTLSESFEKCVTYAKFLKQPLKLEMFVPVDEEGNVLEKPKSCSTPCSPSDFSKEGKCGINGCYSEIPKYEKAKEKVLFEGFEIYKHTKDCIIKDNEIIFEWMENRFSHTGTTIESLTLSHDNFNLTQNAIKQLGL
jgi:hypothetical protein